ncbi:MAG: hypothetical protein ACE5I7_18290 [Candidatus Binatia bacterium]
MSTVVVTMMPVWSERVGVPRTLGVEFPFGHPLGHAHNVDEQLAVIRHALRLLERAPAPGPIEESPITWPDPDHWRTAWEPAEPSPIVQMMRSRGLGK